MLLSHNTKRNQCSGRCLLLTCLTNKRLVCSDRGVVCSTQSCKASRGGRPVAEIRERAKSRGKGSRTVADALTHAAGYACRVMIGCSIWFATSTRTKARAVARRPLDNNSVPCDEHCVNYRMIITNFRYHLHSATI